MDKLQKISRREFLKVSGVTGGGIMLSMQFTAGVLADTAQKGFSANAYVRILPDNAVIISIGQSEMGQGSLTGMAQIIAEELDADWDNVAVERPAASPAFNRIGAPVQSTGGSSSIRGFYEHLLQLGAAGRWMLLEAAAQHWQVPASELKAQSGAVVNSKNETLNYGELSSIAAKLSPPDLARVTLKSPADYQIIGQSLARVDVPQKTTGEAVFGLDIRLPEMLTAVVLRPPAFGAKIENLDARQAKNQPGVVDVFEISEGVAVVANSYWRALKARQKIVVQWSDGTIDFTNDKANQQALSSAADQPGLTAFKQGKSIPDADKLAIQSEYFVPYLSQASMEPLNCTVHIHNNIAEVWTGTQFQSGVKAAVAGLTGIEPADVIVNTPFLGGGFGRRSVLDFVKLATEVAMKYAVPVKTVYSREDDMKGGYYRPAACCKIASELDANGIPTSLAVKLAVPSLVDHTGFKFLQRPDGVDVTAVEGFTEHSFPYSIANISVDWIKHDPGVPVWFWRSVGASQNAYFLETFIDQLARQGDNDPLALRLSLLKDKPRFTNVLNLVAEKAGWNKPLVQGKARGIAVAESFGSVCAQVVEVSLENDSPVVEKVTCAIDAGRLINPALVEAQMYSSIIYALSAVYSGQVNFSEGKVTQTNFWDYPVVRMNQTPQMDVILVENDAYPGGVGEPGTPPLAPAVCNALLALTGEPVLKLPLAGQTFKMI